MQASRRAAVGAQRTRRRGDKIGIDAGVELFEHESQRGVRNPSAFKGEQHPAAHPHDRRRTPLAIEGMVLAQQTEQLVAPPRIGGDALDQGCELQLRHRAGHVAQHRATSPAVLAEEPPGGLLVFRRRLAGAEATDALHQCRILRKGLVAKLCQCREACRLDVVVVRPVHQDVARVFLHPLRPQRIKRRRSDLADLAELVLVEQQPLKQRSGGGVRREQPQRLPLVRLRSAAS